MNTTCFSWKQNNTSLHLLSFASHLSEHGTPVAQAPLHEVTFLNDEQLDLLDWPAKSVQKRRSLEPKWFVNKTSWKLHGCPAGCRWEIVWSNDSPRTIAAAAITTSTAVREGKRLSICLSAENPGQKTRGVQREICLGETGKKRKQESCQRTMTQFCTNPAWLALACVTVALNEKIVFGNYGVLLYLLKSIPLGVLLFSECERLQDPVGNHWLNSQWGKISAPCVLLNNRQDLPQ